MQFSCLYTHQKQKKAKVWQDGILRYVQNQGKVILYDNPTTKKPSNQLKLDSLFVAIEDLCEGAELEFERYLVTIEQRLDQETEESTNLRVIPTAPVVKPPPRLPAYKKVIPNQQSAPIDAFSTVEPIGSKQMTQHVNPISQPVTQPSQISPTPSTLSNVSSPPTKRQKINVSPVEPLKFLSKDDCKAILSSQNWQNHPTLLRHTNIPVRFKDLAHYKDIMIRATIESIQVQLNTLACQFHSVNSSIEQSVRQRGMPYYSTANLTKVNIDPSRERFQGARKGNYILNVANREAYACYSKEDVWIVSSSPNFDPSNTFLAKSFYYGPSSNGNVEMTPLTEKDNVMATLLLSQPLMALRGPNACSEFMSIENIKSNLTKTPLSPHLLAPKISKPMGFRPPSRTGLIKPGNLQLYHEIMEQTISQHHLNQDQAQVVREFATSLVNSDQSPITLALGVFGAGKSFLVAVTIIFLSKIKAMGELLLTQPSKFKVVIASMTNVAVDRVLLALLKMNYTDFVRVGSLKKISKSILPFAAQSQTNEKEELQELESLLNQNLDPTELKLVQDTIRKFKSSENKNLVSQAFCLATTCISSVTSPALEGLEITSPIVILDECSQMTEPMSLLPLARFNCEKALLVGDDKQLPPTIPSGSSTIGLERTIFERLSEMGCNGIMLRTQYRCHPSISRISNSLFYSNQLIDGKSMDELSPLSTLPTLCLINVKGQESFFKASMINQMEVDVIVRIVRQLMNSGISSDSIGIICLYKAQADAILQTLGKKSVQVSTVDAFQGAEKQVIILSTVRTKSSGFIDDPRRVNVALTRCQRHLFIVGNYQLLRGNGLWNRVLDHVRDVVEVEQFYEILQEMTTVEIEEVEESGDIVTELELQVTPPALQVVECDIPRPTLFSNLVKIGIQPQPRPQPQRNNKAWLSNWSAEEELI